MSIIPTEPTEPTEPALDTCGLISDTVEQIMKTAYELAMERLSKNSPTIQLTEAQKKEIAELESKYAAKLAERELFLKGEMVKAIDRGDAEAVDQLEKQLASDRKSLRAELEERKEKVRQGTQ